MTILSQRRLTAAELLEHSRTFRERIRAVKQSAGSIDFEWYPHDSLTGLEHLARLVTGERREIGDLFGDLPVLDVGCQDGEISFLLESMGYPVVALDHPATNHNGMRGVRLLKSLLNSRIEIREVDVDTQFELGEESYGLAFCLGVLYHLQNPFYALRALAKRCRYCYASTRVARSIPGAPPLGDSIPWAYLLDECELNDDDSNYWILSHACLRRMLTRTYWAIEDYRAAGVSAVSDPTSLANDERAFFLLKSRFGLKHLELLDGWYPAEEAGWRWTRKSFSARWSGEGYVPDRLVVHLFVPPDLIESVGPVELRVSVNGRKLAEASYSEQGRFCYERRLPGGLERELLAEFTLDKALAGHAKDARELGLVVGGIDFE